MLHLSEFSGPDALLKSTEGCSAEPSVELSRLPAREASATASYPGGKERGERHSDGGAAQGARCLEMAGTGTLELWGWRLWAA